jgi:hypothetical protein
MQRTIWRKDALFRHQSDGKAVHRLVGFMAWRGCH